MRDYDYQGEWFLPGLEKKIPGRVSIKEETKVITLEIFGNQMIEGTEIRNLFDPDKHRFHPLILGDGMQQVTLYNCSLARTQTIGRDMYQVEYRAQLLFYDVHIVNADFLVQSASFTFPYLASWYDGWEWRNNIKLDESAEFGIRAELGDREPDRINASQELTLALYDKVSRRMIESGVHHSVKYQKSIVFEYQKAVSFETIINDAEIFRKLLEFTYGKPIPYKLDAIEVSREFLYLEKSYLFENKDLVTCYLSSYIFNDGKDVNKHERHQNNMLISRWNCSKDVLHQSVKNWYANTHLHTIYDYYLDSNNWLQDSSAHISNVMFNNRFLNLIQGLEDYYRKFMDQGVQKQQDFDSKKQQVLACIKDAALKQWLNNNFKPPKHIKLEEKLQAILELVRPLFFPSLTEHPIFVDFSRYAKDKRNELSHGKNKETYQGEMFEVNFYLAQIVLGICILQSIGISAINKKIQHHIEWNDYLNRIIQFKV